jgi:Fe-Mn family superoxide dismutase
MKYLNYILLGTLSLLFFSCTNEPTPNQEGVDYKAARDVTDRTEPEDVPTILKYHKTKESELLYPFAVKTVNQQFDYLEPVIQEESLEKHYRLHENYADSLNKWVMDHELQNTKIFTFFKESDKYPERIMFYAGGHYNHTLLWHTLTSPGGTAPEGKLKEKILEQFNSFGDFKGLIMEKTRELKQNGWVWLAIDYEGNLFVSTTIENNNPIMEHVAPRGIPIMTIDLWEHAYHEDYRGNKESYLQNVWKIINWDEVERRYMEQYVGDE